MSKRRDQAERVGAAKWVIWARRSEVPPFPPAPGIQVQPVIGESLMTCCIAMEPGAVVVEHSHPKSNWGWWAKVPCPVRPAGGMREMVVGTPTWCRRIWRTRGSGTERRPSGGILRSDS